MALRNAILVFLFTVLAASVQGRNAWACNGTFQPFCGQTAYIAKFAANTLVNPPSGAAIQVPVGVVPYAIWNATSTACAQPVSATASLSITCTPAGGGAPVQAGTQSVPVGTPTVPGPQSVLTGQGGTPVLGGPFLFTIAAGTLFPGTSYACNINGTYTVNFGAGVGSGAVTGRGDNQVCVVEASPADPTLPRLGLRAITGDDNGVALRLRGDPAKTFYLLENNDLNNSVTLDFSSTARAAAVMPSGADTDNTLFSLMDPLGKDNFDQRIAMHFGSGDPVDLTDPDLGPAPPAQTSLTLAPGGLGFIEVDTRSNGMCPDGSCSEISAVVEGAFGDAGSSALAGPAGKVVADPALACAGGIQIVDENALPRWPFDTFVDTVKAGEGPFKNDALFSHAHLIDSEEYETHHRGNTFPAPDGEPVTQVTHPDLAEQFLEGRAFATAKDSVRLNTGLGLPFSHTPYNIGFHGQVFPEGLNFSQNINHVTITGVGSPPDELMVNMVARTSGFFAELAVDIDLEAETVTVTPQDGLGGGFQVGLDDFSQGILPAGFTQPGACRTFRFVPGTTLLPPVGANPAVIARVLRDLEPLIDEALDKLVAEQLLTGNAVNVTATSQNDFISLGAFDTVPSRNAPERGASGTTAADKVDVASGQLLQVRIDPDKIATAPDTSVGLITITSAEALNSPIIVPVAARKSSTAVPPPLTSILPLSRSTGPATSGSGAETAPEKQGGLAPATFFATLINTGTNTAGGCTVAAGAGLPNTVEFRFQRTDAANAPIGEVNEAFDVTPGGAQTLVLSLLPTEEVAPVAFAPLFACTNGTSAAANQVNTIQYSASMDPVPDVIALIAAGDSGIVDIPAVGQTGVAAVATINIGAAASITARTDTGGVSVPVTIQICRTNPDGSCQAAPTETVTSDMGENETATFGIFVTAQGTVPFDPANNRFRVIFESADGVIRGLTGAAMRTL